MPSLGHDMETIRKTRGISLTEIHNTTKISSQILNAIEDHSIYDNMANEAIYIRGYVRTYADAINLEMQKVIQALDEAERGHYTGSLLDDNEQQEQDSSAPDEGNKEDKKSDTSDKLNDINTATLSSSTSQHNKVEKPESTDIRAGEERAVDWANLGTQFQSQKTSGNKKKIGIIIGLLFIIAAAILIYWYSTSSASSSGHQSDNKSPSQMTLTETKQTEVPSLSNSDSASLTVSSTSSNELSDTLTIVVYAAYDKLEPIRIYTDISDVLNPYWIEQGEAIAFNFVNSFQFRSEIDKVLLLMNGHPLSDLKKQFYNHKSGRIEINRSFFEGDSKWTQPPSDTMDLDVPAPSVVHQLDY